MHSEYKTAQTSALESAVHHYLQTGTGEDKEKVVLAGEALINYYAALYSSGRFDEDLKQAGYEGLLKALHRYEPQRGIMFSTYAAHCIIGEIRHDLRNRGPFKVPDWLKSLQARVINATEELAQKNGHMPTLHEIAQKINVSAEGIVEAMQAGCVSLDEVDLSKVKSLRYESFKLPIEDVITVQMSLDKMDELQKNVITLIYYQGLTQEEAAKKLGINQRKVSRLLKRSLNEMRAYVT
ncbi:MAG TPA: sigma-70 family RNA polymerase sigma factor [Candidatus Limnocylindrales bacterium]|nr:sigma-70 family RNA polymerase sigma factor [Candidatus Limnocylindrales bacterium]